MAPETIGFAGADPSYLRKLWRWTMARCLYCGAGLRSSSPVDHVLPWSRVGIDGPANLVPACERCNSDKPNALPAVETVTRVLGRDRSPLDQIGSRVGWPMQYERVWRTAQGLYRGSPEGYRRGTRAGRSLRWT